MSGATSARRANPDLKAEARRIIVDLKRTVRAAETHWFFALMQAVRDWPLTHETTGGRTYRYLVGGEAFDWLLLAERLCDEIEGLIPDEEREALLFRGRLPEDVDDNDVERLLGAKHRAHLNFVYGIRVEEALQLAVAEEVQKERFASRLWENGHADDEVFHRLYGATRPDLLAEFLSKPNGNAKKAPRSAHPEVSKDGAEHNGRDSHQDSGPATANISLADLTEFTYWLFRRRVSGSEPARVASDTRKGLAQLQRLEWRRKSGTPAAVA
ncbi:MAG TPA: hypothetical protein VGR43_00920 [Dehalococcoidia bacterium]|jgi:hypothetical protein|nr:hypothetical protein [Dehalococcoidia bacterium]